MCYWVFLSSGYGVWICLRLIKTYITHYYMGLSITGEKLCKTLLTQPFKDYKLDLMHYDFYCSK